MKGLFFWSAGVILSIFAILYGVFYLANKFECYRTWNGTSIEYRTHKLSCQVKHPTVGWIPEKSFRVTE